MKEELIRSTVENEGTKNMELNGKAEKVTRCEDATPTLKEYERITWAKYNLPCVQTKIIYSIRGIFKMVVKNQYNGKNWFTKTNISVPPSRNHLQSKIILYYQV